MAYKNFVAELCTGTDLITLTGAASNHLSFVEADYVNGNTFEYVIEDGDGINKVGGIGTYNTDNTITRNDTWTWNGTDYNDSPNGNLTLSGGTHVIRVAPLASTFEDLVSHGTLTNNPHSVTAAQVGLGNVDNTADADKPISTATQSALDLKADTTGYNNSNWDTAFSWGNHSGLYLPSSGNATLTGGGLYLDNTYGIVIDDFGGTPRSVIDINASDVLRVGNTTTATQLRGSSLQYNTNNIFHEGNFTDNSTNWDLAYSWGDHALAGYSAAHTHPYLADTTTHDDLSPNPDQHIDWTLTNAKNIHPDNYTNTTYTSSDFTHDNLSGVNTNQHLDWTASGVGTIHATNLPGLALTTVNTVANEAAQLALTVQEGDVAIRTDEGRTYAHNGGSAGTMADWSEILTPSGGVTTVDGQSGAVTLSGTYAPLSHNHVIADITDFTDNSTNWNTAFGWGNHASAGYLTSETSHANVAVTDANNNFTADQSFSNSGVGSSLELLFSTSISAGYIYGSSDGLGFTDSVGSWAFRVERGTKDVTNFGNVLPNADSSLDVGTSGLRWNNVYAINFVENGSNLSTKYAPSSHNHVIADITDFTDNSTNWNTAFGWGDHSGLYVPIAQAIPAGGTAGQVLKKQSNTDYDYIWDTDASGAGGTNLGWTASTSTITSDTGTNAVLTAADGTNAGLLTSSLYTKLNDLDDTNIAYTNVANTFSATQTFQGAIYGEGGIVRWEASGQAMFASRSEDVSANGIVYQTGNTAESGSVRWFAGKQAGAETGSNTGSNFGIGRYDDSGAWINYAFTINRATGDANFLNSLSVTEDLTVTGDVTGNNLNISLWDDAYNWGDHSVAGYASSGHTHTSAQLPDLLELGTDNTNSGQLYIYGGSTGIPEIRMYPTTAADTNVDYWQTRTFTDGSYRLYTQGGSGGSRVVSVIDSSNLRHTHYGDFTVQGITGTTTTVTIGLANTNRGWLDIQANGSTQGAVLVMYNHGSADSVIDRWQWGCGNSGELSLTGLGGTNNGIVPINISNDGTINFGTAIIGNGTFPTGGTVGQVLEKVDGTDYNVQWVTPSGGDVGVSGTPADNQISVFTDASTIEGSGELTYSAGILQVSNSSAYSILKGVSTDSTSYGQILVENDLGERGQFFIYGSTATGNSLGVARAGNAFVQSSNADLNILTLGGFYNMRLGTNDLLAMTIDGSNQNVTFENTVTANAFVGDGSGLTNLPSSGGSTNWTFITGAYTAVAGDRLACDTSGGAFTVTLPASASAGDIIEIVDNKGDLATNNLTIGRNGHNIDSIAEDVVARTSNSHFWLQYVDATIGWDVFGVISGSGSGSGGNGATAINDLDDVDTITTSPSNNDVLTWTGSEWVPQAPAGGSGEVNQNAFSTVTVSGQNDVVADSATDTLNLVAGSNVTITTDDTTDSVTIAASTGGGGETNQNAFSNVAVAGQTTVAADSKTDTLTLVAGSNVTITTDAGSDSITIASSGGGGETPAITSNGSTPSLNTGITASEVRSLIGAQASGTYLTSASSLDSSNLTGTISDGLLPNTITSSITGNAATSDLAAVATEATNTTVGSDTDNTVRYVTFVSGSGAVGQKRNGLLRYNPSTDVLTAGTFNPSDEKLKDMEGEYHDKSLTNLKCKKWKWKDKGKKVLGTQFGYTAQDVQQNLPDAVYEMDGDLTVNYVMVHSAKIQDLEDEMEDLKLEIETLKLQVQQLLGN